MSKDIIIDPEWEERNELRGKWGSRPKREEPEDLDPFGVDKREEKSEPEFEIKSKHSSNNEIPIEKAPAPEPQIEQEPPFDPDPIEEPDSFAEPEKMTRSKMQEYMGMLLSGSILSKAEVRRVYPYMIFIAFLMLLYISGVFRMQQLHRREIELTRQVKELRATSLELASRRMNATRQSHIMEELKKREIPLKESLTPPKIIKK